MKIREIEAKTILGTVRQPDPIFGLKYNLNLYRGCQHQCIYCDSRSACYQIEDFEHEVLVKVNAPEVLERELARKRIKGTVGTGSMNDPYMPLEAQYHLTRRILQLLLKYGFGVHIITKSALVERDMDLLAAIGQTYAAVTFTITTVDDGLAQKLEPGAPISSRRFEAMARLATNGVYTGVSLMPILPFIEDQEDNIRGIVRQVAEAGGKYIIPWFSVTLRDRQRDYFYQKLDSLFPGVRQRYEKTYGERYGCVPINARRLEKVFNDACDQYQIARQITPYVPNKVEQLKLEF